MAERVEIELIVTGLERANTGIANITRQAGSMGGAFQAASGPTGFFGHVLANIASYSIVSGLLAVRDSIIGIGEAVTDYIGSSIQTAADFEQSIADIAAVANLTGDQIGSLEDAVKAVALNPQLVVSFEEAAQVADLLARAGVDVDDSFQSVLEQVILLQNATGGTFVEAGEVAVKLMAQFGLESEELAAAIDGVGGSLNASIFDLSDYNQALGMGGGTMAGYGASIEDFNQILALTSTYANSGSDAGTALKVMFGRLTPDTDKARQAMLDLGLATENADGSLQNAFYTTEGFLRPASELFTIMRQIFGGMSEQDLADTGQMLFGQDAIRPFLGIIQATDEDIASIIDKVGNFDAELAAAIRTDTFAAKMEIFGDLMESIKLIFGESVGPIAETLTELGIDVASVFAEKLEPALQKFGAIIVSDILPAMNEILSVFGINVMDDFSLSFAEGVDTIAGAGFDKVFGWIADRLEDFGAWLSENAPAIKGFFGGLKDAIQGNNPALSAFGDFWERLMEIQQQWSEEIAPGVQYLFDKLAEFWNTHGEDIIDIAGRFFNVLLDQAAQWAEVVGPNFVYMLVQVGNFFADHGDEIVLVLGQIADALNFVTGLLFGYLEIMNNVGTIVTELFLHIAGAALDAHGIMFELKNEALQWGWDIISQMGQGIRNAAGQLWDAVRFAVHDVFERLFGILGIPNPFASLGRSITASVANGVTQSAINAAIPGGDKGGGGYYSSVYGTYIPPGGGGSTVNMNMNTTINSGVSAQQFNQQVQFIVSRAVGP